MNLTDLLTAHKESFKEKFIEALAKKNSMTADEVRVDFKSFIEQFAGEKYNEVSQVVKRINEIEIPVFLNIRRDRMREEKCKICEGNEPNVLEIKEKYGNRIEIFEVIEDRPEGLLYQIIFYEEAEEKKLPLTAIINRGELMKFWAGKTVDAAVYERYINKYLAKS
ncbi:MAG: hypothetical protein MPEBLZ_01019 [Candidatus Methanoperedens nitroreducens]|uniref:Uncharacterized protein n=1 Tax=Candidatus Methanoperedens nitratireducens TaxID=1392998 RepID=A0A0N8KRA4_9EURY|nr:MAG: hypothetical protein MPEBLZ_01019 [Candidatus Methanoperedens sp. BLZ1]MCX9089143.1 hypothetical protein [Candidatus Methanoperedens sp.]